MDFFRGLEDPRRPQGRRHRLEDVLAIVVMAILSGHQGIRGFARFAAANAGELTGALGLGHGAPSYRTFHHVLSHLCAAGFARAFQQWAAGGPPGDGLVALDGKAVRSTVEGGNTPLQDFTAVVSAFGHGSGLVHGMEAYHNGRGGEAAALRELVSRLGLRGATYTVDALHAQKKPWP
jgi:hypothetical protein